MINLKNILMVGVFMCGTLYANDYKEGELEMKIMNKFSEIKSGVKIWDVDVDLDNLIPEVNIELSEKSDKISQNILENYSKKIADFIREELNRDTRVLIEIEIDREYMDKKLIKERF